MNKEEGGNMNTYEEQMKNILSKLKEEYGLVGIRGEFEAEGSRYDDLIYLSNLSKQYDLKLYLKVGGAEALTDIRMAKDLSCDAIICPMIETDYALQKYISSLKKVYTDISDIEKIINIETITGYKNLKDILYIAEESIDTISVGRVDLSKSIGLDRDGVINKEVSYITEDILTRAYVSKYMTCFGGGVDTASIPFIDRVKDILYRFETRKVVFDTDMVLPNIDDGLNLAACFEYYYLLYRKEYYKNISEEDDKRIMMLKNRLQKNNKKVLTIS